MNEEEELKEELERYERQNQEAYDMSIENEIKRTRIAEEAERQALKRKLKGEVRRKQRQDRKQVQSGGNTGEKFIPDKTEDFAPAPDVDMRTGERIYDTDEEKDQFGRLASSIAFETGANTLLDIFSFIPPAQVAGSGVINYIAQRIRGGEFSYGELVASGLASLIPGGAQGTAAAKLAKSTAKGAVSGGVQTTSMIGIDEGRLPTAEELATGAGLGGAFGGLFQTIGNVKQVDDFLYQTKRRLQGGDFVPMDNPFAQGSVGAARRKPGPRNPDEQAAQEAAGQGNIFKSFLADPRLGETDAQIMDTYKNYRIQKGDPYVDPKKAFKRGLVTRKIKVKDLEPIVKEHPEIPKDKINEYIQFVNRESKAKDNNLGKTITFLNDAYINGRLGLKKLGNLRLEDLTPNQVRTGSPQEIAEDMSSILNKRITVKTLDNIIQEKVSIPVEISDEVVMQVTDLKSLTKAYMARVNRFTGIPAFERGHVFAAKNIFDDPNITSLSDYKGNLEPEISRSIYNIVDGQSFNDLLNGVDLEDIIKGNRSRSDKSDPDKVVARLLGTDYGLRESFLNFVYPQRALSNKIPADAKASFIDDYVEEMDIALRDYDDGGTVGVHTLDFIRAGVLKKILPKYEALNDELIKGLITTTDLVTGKNMSAEVNEAITRNLVNPQEIRRKGEAR